MKELKRRKKSSEKKLLEEEERKELKTENGNQKADVEEGVEGVRRMLRGGKEEVRRAEGSQEGVKRE